MWRLFAMSSHCTPKETKTERRGQCKSTVLYTDSGPLILAWPLVFSCGLLFVPFSFFSTSFPFFFLFLDLFSFLFLFSRPLFLSSASFSPSLLLSIALRFFSFCLPVHSILSGALHVLAPFRFCLSRIVSVSHTFSVTRTAPSCSHF